MSVNLIALKNASSLVSTNTQKAFNDDLENAFQNHLKQLSAPLPQRGTAKTNSKPTTIRLSWRQGNYLSFNEKAPSTNANMRSRG
ncbi:MAG: hypothetical protein IPO31_20215 [Candidatus Obscuribacter sp.]|nr:hypothetical protein [Candidatus Obscuribacter sp.]